MWQYPLKDWKTLRRGSVPFGVKYPKTKFMGPLGGQKHVGTDVICRTSTPLYAPCDGFVKTTWGKDGGNTILFKDYVFGYLHRMLHNSRFVKRGEVKKGDLIAYTGNTGKSSTPHVHYDISKSGKLELSNFDNFLDPEEFYRTLDIEEIKKNMNILLACNTTFTPHLLANRVIYVKEFFKIHFKIDVNIEFKKIDLKEVKWKGNELEREWLAFNVVPYASGFDGLVLWLDPKDWKPTDKIGVSYPDQILGVHCIAFTTTESTQDTRWNVPDNSEFTGILRHELCHMIAQRTGKWSNNTEEWKSGFDNTHHYDFTKKLEQFAPEINLNKFEGWIPKQGVRLFKYNNPSKLKWAFSGTVMEGKVFKSIDNRMFFACTKHGWKIITEQEFSSALNSGKHWGYMSVPEANKIYFDLNVPVPYSPPHHIMYALATSTFKEVFLKLLGYSENIPSRHL